MNKITTSSVFDFITRNFIDFKFDDCWVNIQMSYGMVVIVLIIVAILVGRKFRRSSAQS